MELLRYKINFLEKLLNEEHLRQEIIERKTSQLMGQSGIILAISALLVSFVNNDIFLNTGIIIKFFLLILFVVCVGSFIVSIFRASLVLDAHKYSYGSRNYVTIENTSKDLTNLLLEEKTDLIYCIKRNIKLNNTKATHLNWSNFFYKMGLIFLSIFALAVILILMISPELETIERTIQLQIFCDYLIFWIF